MHVIVEDDYDQLSRYAAQIVADLIRDKPNAVLGLATGSTPLGLYRELVRMHRDEGLDFASLTTFNLDEYIGLSADHEQSYHFFMHEHLFRHINVPGERIFIPSGTAEDQVEFCSWYESQIVAAGGIDLQLLGIGSDGHIAFNEPGSPLDSRTRVEALARQTIEDNSRFFDSIDDVPASSITMGVGTILEAKRILLLASGANKAAALAAAVEGPVSSECTASALQRHADTLILADRAAAGQLAIGDA